MNDNKEDIFFSSADDLNEWLVTNKCISEKTAEMAAKTLLDSGFNTVSNLIGITFETLKQKGLPDPVAMELKNKLEK